jgi:oligopeptide/dipeptide ABC transporter ATP-binding protein
MDSLLAINNLSKVFKHRRQLVYAVNNFDLSLKPGVTTAVVGESGCGKSTLAKIILGFYPPDKGHIYFQGTDITVKKNRKIIRNNIQIVFQNPFLSFNPRYRMLSTFKEIVDKIGSVGRQQKQLYIKHYFQKVGLEPTHLYAYPHQLSGGQLQRASLARALMLRPKLLILDEPTSSLDVSTAARIIELLNRLKQETDISYLFISHNIKLVSNIADDIFVIYQGQNVEYGGKEAIFNNPCHPYTRLLLKASQYKLENLDAKTTEVYGCGFKQFCPRATVACQKPPALKKVAVNHFVYCHYCLNQDGYD